MPIQEVCAEASHRAITLTKQPLPKDSQDCERIVAIGFPRFARDFRKIHKRVRYTPQ
jgi:hypothetical protein